MPYLIYHDHEGQYREQEIAGSMAEIHIGSDPVNNTIILPADAGVAPRHAVILRSALNQLSLLVDLAGEKTYVNGQEVVSIKVLRQKDRIQLGQVNLIVWEIRITALRENSPYINRSCLFCTRGLQVNDEVVICPRCETPFHRLCWFSLPNCAKDTCNYPVRDNILDSLRGRVKYEEANVELFKAGQMCSAREPGDQIPFQLGEMVVYCPSTSCRATYHLRCWLELEHCKEPACNFDYRQLLTEVFTVAESSDSHSGRDYGE